MQEASAAGSFDSSELYATGSAFVRKDCLVFPAGSTGLTESGQASEPGEKVPMTVPEGQTMVTAEEYLTRNRTDLDPEGTVPLRVQCPGRADYAQRQLYHG